MSGNGARLCSRPASMKRALIVVRVRACGNSEALRAPRVFGCAQSRRAVKALAHARITGERVAVKGSYPALSGQSPASKPPPARPQRLRRDKRQP